MNLPVRLPFRQARYSSPMKNFYTILFVGLSALLWSTTDVQAEAPGWAAFVAGDFGRARQEGKADGSAEGLSQACRAGLVLGGFVEAGPAAITSLHRAITDCDQALRLQPGHFYAKMSLAIALSFEGKRLMRPRYAKRAKAYIQELIAQEPENPLGYGAIAAWHAEVSAAGFMARLLLGARRKQAKANFATALQLGAIDYALRFEYVKFLAHGTRSERRDALIAAKELMQVKPVLALDKILQKRCAALIGALEQGDKRTINTALKKSTAFQNASPENIVVRFPLDALSPIASQ